MMLNEIICRIRKIFRTVDNDSMFYYYKYCNKCGFVFRYSNHISFEVDKNNKLTETLLPYSKYDKFDESLKLNGKIRFTYCPRCEKYVKIYTILDKFIEEDAFSLLSNLIQNEENCIIIIEEKEKSSNSVQCPECQSNLINKIEDGASCPICGGMISENRN